MEPLRKLSKKNLEKIKMLMFDLDGTFISNDSLKSSSLNSLERLKKVGIKTIVVTGRPAGWCDMIARWWPVDSVIGENGALSYSMVDGKMAREYFSSKKDLKRSKEFLNSLFDEIKLNFGEIYLAADQPFRQWDLALDISEEHRITSNKVKKIYDFCLSRGANAAISNIHLNVWQGTYSKFDMASKLLDYWGIQVNECAYVGDSPNDSPMFERFPLSVGVKSVLKYKDFMEAFPSYVTDSDGSRGFEELVNFILSTR
tara:strand:- start:532 stop:1302 length:771 start_codon:yes stop_codon:yes gene_type:complete